MFNFIFNLFRSKPAPEPVKCGVEEPPVTTFTITPEPTPPVVPVQENLVTMVDSTFKLDDSPLISVHSITPEPVKIEVKKKMRKPRKNKKK
jgi:hypothetical protein